ncbi:MAG: Xaa-Pro peptidase family protein [Amphiplicatus sp.]
MSKGIGGSTAEKELAGIRVWDDPAAPISAEEYAKRIDRAQALMREQEVDALVVGAGASLQYYSSVAWGASERLTAMILAPGRTPLFVCPEFERGSLEAALAIEADIRTWEEDENPYALAAGALKEMSASRVAIDPAMAFWMGERLQREAAFADFSAASGIIDGCRMCKSKAELALMQQAKLMTLEVHRRAARILRPGISSGDVRSFIDQAHKAYGAAGSSFCIVLFGEATSYPHGVPGEQRLKEGDVVLIDTGCTVGGYNSDITRTYVYGEPTSYQREIWSLEHDAQEAAFEAARPGAPCESVDMTARKILERAGLGPRYRLPGLPHRTGHGIGLSVHEAPYLVRGDKTPLNPGMCFSNEPMIVIPGKFGVRLEDHFYMTETGPVWFTLPSPSLDAPFG